MRRTRWLAAVAVGLMAASALAQDEGAAAGGRGQFAGMQRAGGEVTSIAGPTVTVKNEDGVSTQIVTTDNTRVMKGRGVAIKVADVRPGDVVIALGNLDAPNRTLHAAMLMDVMDAAQMKAAKENLGKTYIAGKVTAIDLDNARMTVERPDKIAQVIGFDETTSFKRVRRLPGGAMGLGGLGAGVGEGAGGAEAGESITLADVKVGDVIGGQGAVKAGTFVPAQLNVATPGTGRRRPAAPGAAAGPS